MELMTVKNKSILNYFSQQDIRLGSTKDAPQYRRWLVLLFVFVWAVLFMSGCGVLKPIDQKSPAGASSQSENVLAGVYQDFDDVLIPKSMQVNRKTSSIFETPTITAGVLSLDGRLELDDLIGFFKTNMTKDNWTAVGMFKGPRSILHFEKGNRWCVMTLTDSRYGYKTLVEIWVTPKNDALPSGLLK
jgi:hypothetical protein